MLHGGSKIITRNNCGHAVGKPGDEAIFSFLLFFLSTSLFSSFSSSFLVFSLPPSSLLVFFLPSSLLGFFLPSPSLASSFLPPSLASSFLPLSSLLVFFSFSLSPCLPPSLLHVPGTWTSQPTTGCVPPPCVDFSFTCVDGRRAVVFGGYQPQTGITNDTYLIDMDTWVIHYYENCTIHIYTQK